MWRKVNPSKRSMLNRKITRLLLTTIRCRHLSRPTRTHPVSLLLLKQCRRLLKLLFSLSRNKPRQNWQLEIMSLSFQLRLAMSLILLMRHLSHQMLLIRLIINPRKLSPRFMSKFYRTSKKLHKIWPLRISQSISNPSNQHNSKKKSQKNNRMLRILKKTPLHRKPL